MVEHVINSTRRYRYAKAQRGGFTACRLCCRALELDTCIIESKFPVDACWIAWLQTASGWLGWLALWAG